MREKGLIQEEIGDNGEENRRTATSNVIRSRLKKKIRIVLLFCTNLCNIPQFKSWPGAGAGKDPFLTSKKYSKLSMTAETINTHEII